MMSPLLSSVYVGCFLMVVMVSLPPLSSGGFGKVRPRAPSEKSGESFAHSEEILYHCLRTQQCECKQYYRFESCWEKLPERIQNYVIDEINSCGMDPQVEYGTMRSWTDKLCLVSSNISKACYDKINPIVMKELGESSSGGKGVEEGQQIEEVRKCAEPTIAFCSESPEQCAD